VADGPAQNGVVPEFETRTERVVDSTYIVSVAGEIDLFTGPPFGTALSGALDAGARQLIVDLSECTFMDSTGIGILVRVNERRNHASKPVAVVTEPSERAGRAPDHGSRRHPQALPLALGSAQRQRQ
jgi:anti-sigma B factor antagonist